MAPNARRSAFATLAFAAAAVLIYMFGVLPTQDSLERETRRKADLTAAQEKIRADLATVDSVKKTLAELEEQYRPFADAMLAPLLGSYAMRAKTILDPLVIGAGLHDAEYTEAPSRTLPLTKPMARQLHARAAIRLSATGSYQAAVSFLMRLEKEYPLVSLQSIDVSAQKDPGRQSVSMVLEWPAKGKVTRP